MKMDEMMTIEELCKCLKIGKNTAYGLLKEKKIKGFKAGRCWLIPMESVKRYIEKEIGKR